MRLINVQVDIRIMADICIMADIRIMADSEILATCAYNVIHAFHSTYVCIA